LFSSNPLDAEESQRYLELAAPDGNQEAEVRDAIALSLGRFGLFDIEKARGLLSEVSSSSSELRSDFAASLGNTASEFCKRRSISILHRFEPISEVYPHQSAMP
jgi:hypothetical protein